MAIALVATDEGNGLNGYTTVGMDTTGANLLVWTVADNGGAAPTLTDSYGNTWTQQQRYIPIAVAIAIYYCVSPTVGTGHTFTCSKTAGANSGQIRAYSGVATSSPVDQSNSNLALGSATLQPGSVTPTENDELIVTAMNFDTAASVPTINSSFTNVVGDVGSGGTYLGSCSADLIQTTAAAVNPTWTHPSSNNLYGVIATFKAGSGAVTGTIAATTPEVTGSITGKVTRTGTIAATLAVATMAAVGFANLPYAVPPGNIAMEGGGGALLLEGSATDHLALEQNAGGTVTGTIAVTLPVPGSAIAGAHGVAGPIGATLPPPTAAITGNVGNDTTGTIAVTLPVPSSAIAGAHGVAGTIAVTLPVPSSAIAGAHGVAGTIAVTLPVPSSAFTGAHGVAGTIAVTLPVPGSAFTGAHGVAGPIGATLPPPTAAITGTAENPAGSPGCVDITVSAPTCSISATCASSTITVSAPTCSISATCASSTITVSAPTATITTECC